MRIAIRGYKTLGELKNIINWNELQVAYVIDINASIWGDEREGIPVISPMAAFDFYIKKEFEKVVINPLLGINKITDIVNEMTKMGFGKDSICIPKTADVYCAHHITQSEIKSNKYDFENFRNLYYLEYHIADECNLNCAACSHFSPLVKETYYPDINDICSDLKRLREIVDHIEWIRILGGEPFLNKNWKEYLRITRDIWPYSKISIVTNGLLLGSLTDEELDFLKNNDVWIDISLYKPMWYKIDKIVAELKRKNVKYEVNGTPIFEFTSVYDLKSQDDFTEKRYRCNVPCNNLYKGKMTPCPIMMYTKTFNQYFNQNLPVGEPVDLYDKQLNYEGLVKALKKPMPICTYCNMNEYKSWRQVKRKECKIEDWIIAGN